MRVHADELALAQAHSRSTLFDGLTDEQLLKIMARGRELFHWFKAHRSAHFAINAAVLLFIFATDYWVQVVWPAWWLAPDSRHATRDILFASVLVGAVHSWLMYSLSVFSLHEGAAHRMIFPPEGPISRLLHRLSANLSRLGGGEPDSYAADHMTHHARFGTEHDAEFLNYVKPRRYWLSFLPLAFTINYGDFVAHRPLELTRGRRMSFLWALPYHGLFAWYAWTHFGPLFTILAYGVLLPHLGFTMDRLRQFTEHNLMPLENKNGARSFGLGVWGMLVGGGPWGQPCHWAHHLVPSIPWYQQAILHRYVTGLLTPQQRRQFLIEPITGFPKLWWRLVRGSHRDAARHSADAPVAAGKITGVD